MEDRVLKILGEVNDEILSYAGTNMVDDGLLDSFEIISLIGKLEDEFDIEIDAEYVTFENFANKDTIIKMVAELLND